MKRKKENYWENDYKTWDHEENKAREGRTHQMEKLQERRIQKFMKENSWKNEENSKRIWKEKLQLQRRRLRRRRPRRR